jgi:hypothetical protein
MGFWVSLFCSVSDPDSVNQEGKNNPIKIGKNLEISWFEVLDVLF